MTIARQVAAEQVSWMRRDSMTTCALLSEALDIYPVKSWEEIAEVLERRWSAIAGTGIETGPAPKNQARL
jgi:hypothetical protein